MPHSLFRSLTAFTLLLAGPYGVSAQEAVVNGEFNTDIAGWTILVPAGQASWLAFDRANPMSGSALLFNSAEAPNALILMLRQCIDLTQAGVYEPNAQGFIAPGQQTGRLLVSYDRFEAPQCQQLSGGRGFSLGAIGSWSAAPPNVPRVVLRPAEVGRVSIEVTVSLQKFAAGGRTAANVDSISLRRVTVFADGFE